MLGKMSRVRLIKFGVKAQGWQRLKTLQWDSMKDDRFNDLALMNIHRDILETVEAKKVSFYRQKSEKMWIIYI